MKALLITIGVIGVAVAGIIYYLTTPETSSNQVMNVEDGMPIDAV